MAGLLDNWESWPDEPRMLDQWLDRLEVTAAGHNGWIRLLDLAQLINLSDAALIVSRTVSMRVFLLLTETHAVAVADRMARSNVADLGNENRRLHRQAFLLFNTHRRVARGLSLRPVSRSMCLLISRPLEAFLNDRPWTQDLRLQRVLGVAATPENPILVGRRVLWS